MSENRKILIVGNGPIGRAITERLSKADDVEMIEIEEIIDENLIDQGIDRLGGIDILVNATEYPITGGIMKTEESGLKKAIQMRIENLITAVKQVVPYLAKNKKGGRILNLAGVRGKIATGEHLIEAGVDGAIIAMTREMAVDLEAYGISVNSISPWMAEEGMDDLAKDQFCATTLMDRLITPEDVAIMAEFLVSDDAFTVNAYDMVVDGGMMAFRNRMENSWFEDKTYYH